VAQAQYENQAKAGAYNIGPENCDCVTTGDLVALFCKLWGEGAKWVNLTLEGAPHEAGLLKLDCARIQRELGWKPRWHIEDAIAMTVAWSKAYLQKSDLYTEMKRQIEAYMA
jgi:CDP-glucose 4,6-dehydratase